MRVQTLQVQRQGSVGGGVAGIGECGVLVVVRGLVMVGAVVAGLVLETGCERRRSYWLSAGVIVSDSMDECTVVCVGIGVENEKYGVVVWERGDVAKAAGHGWRSCG